LVPFEIEPVYAATKAAALNFTRSLKAFTPLTGVRVNAICPAFVDTHLITDLRSLSDRHDAQLSRVPKLEPLEVAREVLRAVEDTTMSGDAILLAPKQEPTLLDDKTDVWAILADSVLQAMSTFRWPWSPKEPTACYHIEGFLECAYFHAAERLANQHGYGTPNSSISVSVRPVPRQEWPARLAELQSLVPHAPSEHTTSPFIYQGCGDSSTFQFVGGYDQFRQRVTNNE
ncbi:hypothetical protein IWQ62_005785, partial [Dispira parvispora]